MHLRTNENVNWYFMLGKLFRRKKVKAKMLYFRLFICGCLYMIQKLYRLKHLKMIQFTTRKLKHIELE